MLPNERHYRKTVGAIGGAMLIFWGIINIGGSGIAFLPFLLSLLGASTEVVNVVYQTVYAAVYLLSFMLPVAFLKMFIRKAGYSYTSMRCEVKMSGYVPLIMLAGVAVIYGLAQINASMVSIFDYSDFLFEIMGGAGESPALYQLVLEFITLCVVPGFCEEFLFRGAILTNCLPFGRSNAILISALLFSMMHQNAGQLLYTFAAGILLGVVYERTGNIWTCTVLHIFNNFISLVQGVIGEKLGIGIKGFMGNALFETLLMLVGTVSAVILILRFFSHKEDFSSGFFGRSVPAEDGYAPCSVEASRMRKLFFTPTMVIFLILCALQILFLLVMAVFYGLFV